MIIRDGRERTLQIAVEELVLENQQATRQRETAKKEFGLELGDITASIANQLRLPRGIEGAVVYGVEPDGPADRAGLMEGDVVRSVNRHTVHDASEARQQLRQIGTGQPAFVLVWRDGNEMLVQMRSES